ncbi:MAG: acetylxylan esterase [Clostridia bacterium]|nr:acetylxylan esterase [Clostridia bacterium]
MKNTYQHNMELMKKIKPSMSYNGENLPKWQKEAKEKLAQLLGLDRFTKVVPNVQIEYVKGNETRFTFLSEEGYRVPCHLLLPEGVDNPPLMICVQGHSTGMHISLGRPKYEGDAEKIVSGDRDFAIRALKEGFAAVTIEQRNFGELSSVDGKPGCIYSKLTAELFGRTTVGERVWDVMRLIDVIEAQFNTVVDTKRICLMGCSAGGTTTIYTAALEERIVLAMPICAVCTYKDSIGGMPHCPCNYVPHIAEYFDMNDLIAMACPKYYIQVNGEQDNIFPIAPAKEVYEKGIMAYKDMGIEDRCAFVMGPGGHRFYADLSWPHVHKFIK